MTICDIVTLLLYLLLYHMCALIYVWGGFLPPWLQGLNPDTLKITHAQVNRAPNIRRRTYRAHGRINPYQSSPCHIEFMLTPDTEIVPKSDSAEGERYVLALFLFY